MKNFLKPNWPILLVIILSLSLTWPAFVPGYFSHHDDLQVMRIFEMRKCIFDLQIPCRWVPDMGYGNGYPLFNYYGVFPYYLGALLSLIFGFVGAAKALFAIPLVLGGISMFLLANELFGVYPAILAAVFYSFAPFRALDSYVRGDVAENFAIATLPLIVYFVLKLIRKKSLKYMLGVCLSLAVFLLSHNIMTLLFAPVIFLLILYFLMVEKWKNLMLLILSGLIGIGLSAFFIVPAYFEKNLVQIENLIKLDLNFRAHFVTIKQLFLDRFWGYGASIPGPNDTISFQIGWPHSWIVAGSLVVILFSIIYRKKFPIFPLILLGIFLISVFMTHERSSFIWEKIDVLKFAQFPWRFLAVTIFSASLLGAYFVQAFKGIFKKILVMILIILIFILNFNFFKPQEFYPDINDNNKLSGKLWEDQQKAAVLDYLPQTAVQPREAAPFDPLVKSGRAKVLGFDNKSNRWQFKAQVEDQVTIEVPVFDFPVWQVKVNGQDKSFSNKNYLGRISLDLGRGDYLVTGKFTDTPIRRISNIVTILSLIGLFGIMFYGKIKKNFR